MKTYIKNIFTLILVFNINYLLAQSPSVSGISPQRQVINAPRGTSISATFNRALNVQSINSSTFRVFGKLSGPAQVHSSFWKEIQKLYLRLMFLSLPESGLQSRCQKAYKYK